MADKSQNPSSEQYDPASVKIAKDVPEEILSAPPIKEPEQKEAQKQISIKYSSDSAGTVRCKASGFVVANDGAFPTVVIITPTDQEMRYEPPSSKNIIELGVGDSGMTFSVIYQGMNFDYRGLNFMLFLVVKKGSQE